MKKNNILIVSGIYPPSIGGPAQYAFNLERVFKNKGFVVDLAIYTKLERLLPIGFRHLYFCIKSILKIRKANRIIVLDTFSVALPTAFACMLLRKDFLIRTGGDFLWESYVERTKKKILFRDFYNTSIKNINLKEKIIFLLTKWILKRAKHLVFSTNWQLSIWKEPYEINLSKTKIINNYFSKIEKNLGYKDKVFFGGTRNLVWKNTDLLKSVFEDKDIKEKGFFIDFNTYSSRQDYYNNIVNSYAVILVSLGDISPNTILDAISFGKPFICTRECGLFYLLKDIGIWVDPLDKKDIKEKIIWLLEDDNYKIQSDLVKNFNMSHSWEDIVNEFNNINI